MAALGEQNFRFDLDSDGKLDTISFAAPGSGFLALDINENGSIDDGSELFGPKSGNGFNDLAAYDSDGNSWIDENDPIYNKLRIWSMDTSGALKLEALGKVGVGAIYLGNVETSYRLLNNTNQERGTLARSGIFLNENGTAGTIQHVDLAVK